ncbi:hypothetical protein T492DRAFT_408862 [Pavlovales sp. CCMP2436]|nr:hypothetical protein T492DRAFT_408862 [Pavlovales sp. CCMP2436]
MSQAQQEQMNKVLQESFRSVVSELDGKKVELDAAVAEQVHLKDLSAQLTKKLDSLSKSSKALEKDLARIKQAAETRTSTAAQTAPDPLIAEARAEAAAAHERGDEARAAAAASLEAAKAEFVAERAKLVKELDGERKRTEMAQLSLTDAAALRSSLATAKESEARAAGETRK